jgi:uncharacterized OB-fold protein
VDGFTLVARAVELLGPGAIDRSSVARLILVGDLPPPAAEDLSRFLGVTLDLERQVLHAPSLPEAMDAALAPDPPGPALVLAVSVRGSGESSPTRGPDAGRPAAIALWVDERGPAPEPFVPGSVAPLTIDQLRREAGEHGAFWVPPRRAANHGGDARAEPPGMVIAPDLPVAQGAYVPWPRYAEGTLAHWNLGAERCTDCGALTFPPRGRCRPCEKTTALTPVRLDPGSGRVVASTRIGPGGQPTEFDDQVAREGPYGVVVVEFEGGVRATLQVADHSGGPLPIGTPVGTEIRRAYPMEGRWRYARKAVPRPPPGSGPSR